MPGRPPLRLRLAHSQPRYPALVELSRLLVGVGVEFRCDPTFRLVAGPYRVYPGARYTLSLLGDSGFGMPHASPEAIADFLKTRPGCRPAAEGGPCG